MTHDLASAAERMAGLVRGVAEEQLDAPTPCAEYSVAALLDHISTLAVGLAGAARKEGGAPPPPGDATNLDPSWRITVPAQVEALAAAWREPGALEGTLAVGGIEMPAEAAFTVALEELVLHGWDLAKATGQEASCDGPELEAVLAMVQQFRSSGAEGLFGPPVPVPDDAPVLERILGLAGRHPDWEPPR